MEYCTHVPTVTVTEPVNNFKTFFLKQFSEIRIAVYLVVSEDYFKNTSSISTVPLANNVVKLPTPRVKTALTVCYSELSDMLYAIPV